MYQIGSNWQRYQAPSFWLFLQPSPVFTFLCCYDLYAESVKNYASRKESLISAILSALYHLADTIDR